MGMLRDAAPPSVRKAMQEYEEFVQPALSAAVAEGGAVGDAAQYEALFRAWSMMARQNQPFSSSLRSRLDELETSLRLAGVSDETIQRLEMAHLGEDANPSSLADEYGVDVEVTKSD